MASRLVLKLNTGSSEIILSHIPMKIKFLLPAVFFFSFISVVPPYKIGDKINNFTLDNATDDARISLNDFAANKGIVLVFTVMTVHMPSFMKKDF
jgi:hypothetical protein